MRLKPLILAGFVSLGLAPGTFVRTIPPPPDYTSPVLVERLPVEEARIGPFTLVGSWRLNSRNDHFGGYSALLAWPDGRLLAASDAGRLMILPRPDRKGGGSPKLAEFADYSQVNKKEVDIESLAQNPVTGAIWAGFEMTNSIARFGPGLSLEKRIYPSAMADWGGNSGPESLVRLADGRFLAIEERATGAAAAHHRALLFPSDPTAGQTPLEKVLTGLEGFRPVDATPLPDGRVLVLFRRIAFGLPPGFATAIGILDPRRDEMRVIPLASFGEAIPQENYEGLALTVEGDGARHIWLISDDNFAAHQRTLLLKLRWDPPSEQRKARR